MKNVKTELFVILWTFNLVNTLPVYYHTTAFFSSQNSLFVGLALFQCQLWFFKSINEEKSSMVRKNRLVDYIMEFLHRVVINSLANYEGYCL